ncbi:MAG TPA: hypothetical protein VNR18_10605 [Hyphomicrobiales bacterium]|nr:hypothetical protein [Hyphomicrobiales bacterium]
MRLLTLAFTTLLLSLAACSRPLPDIRIMDTQVFPESLSSDAAGNVYVGSTKGIVYRAQAGTDQARPWIQHDAENGILAILGVLADDASATLWLCSAPNFLGPERSEGTSALKAFDLRSGAFKGSWDFPPPASVCNDITIAPDGSAYASDTSNGRIFKLAPRGTALELFGSDPALVGIDGLAFSGDGVLYANNVRTQEVFRVESTADGRMGALTSLQLSHTLGGPDGMRLIADDHFLQAEGTLGRVGILSIEGNVATLDILRDDFVSTPAVTLVGDTAYVLESHIGYVLDPALQGQEPPPFMIYAVPLEK